MAKVDPGTYQCKTTAATIFEAASGAVMCRIALDIGLTGGICLIQKDGTLSERGFKDVQAILGLSSWNWADWEKDPEEWAGHDVEAVVEIQQGDRGEFSTVKYLNPPGGAAARMEKADAKTLATKYGAKTRALFGGTPAKSAAPAGPPASRPKPPAPAAKQEAPLATSTMEICWDKWLEAGNDGDPDKWYQAVKKATGKEQNVCTPQDWGKMFRDLTDNFGGPVFNNRIRIPL